jgi:hypothetical protein
MRLWLSFNDIQEGNLLGLYFFGPLLWKIKFNGFQEFESFKICNGPFLSLIFASFAREGEMIIKLMKFTKQKRLTELPEDTFIHLHGAFHFLHAISITHEFIYRLIQFPSSSSIPLSL